MRTFNEWLNRKIYADRVLGKDWKRLSQEQEKKIADYMNSLRKSQGAS